MREFLYVDDMAEASVFVLELDRAVYDANTQPMLSHINVGTGEDCSIRELAEKVKCVTGYSGDIVFDATKPDGTARKLMDVSRLHAIGWRYRVPLEQGLRQTYDWYLANQSNSATKAVSPA
jgi:GDP-L-fucose synthase